MPNVDPPKKGRHTLNPGIGDSSTGSVKTDATEPKVSLSDGAANYTSYYRTYSSRTITFTLHTISTHILVSMNPTNRKISL